MKLFYRDFKYQLNKFKYASIAMILIYAFMIFLSNIDDNKVPLFKQFFNYAYIDAGIINILDEFFIPNHWLLLHLIPTGSLILIIIKDHYDNGIYSLMKVKKKTTYFYSKILASSFVNILIIAIFVLFLFIGSNFNKNYDQDYALFFIRIMFCLILENIILTFIGVLIALMFSTRFSLFFLVLNLSLAMLTNFQYIIGQASLAFKQEFLGGAFSFSDNLIYLLLALVITVAFSYFYFSKYNFYGDEK